MNNKEIGDFGENVACNYLIKNGYKILERNYRVGFDEIDIIAKNKDKTLLFIEVKTIMQKNINILGFMPEDQMTGFKLKKIARACQKFSVRHPQLIDDEKGWRIDLIAITLKTEKTGILHHYKNL
jgi:putative endonuclease